MEQTMPLSHSVRERGRRLKAMRVKHGITLREVEIYSRHIARLSGDKSFVVPRSSLDAIEKFGSPTPDIHRLISLCVIYRVRFAQLLLVFDLNLDDIATLMLQVHLPHSNLIPSEIFDTSRQVQFPVLPDGETDLGRTRILNHLVENWGEIPLAFLQRLTLHEHLYAIIGTRDLTMNPLIPPGSLVQIDNRDTKIQISGWKTDLERPIYFLQLRESYACGWCEVTNGILSIIPFSATQRPIKQYQHPGEIEVIGRVTVVVAAWVPFSRRSGK
jgi:hypothetical protein